jgi:hypothetical protein|tara:strand:- start:50 stop:292 length:243 start_codon:yes stop_codon:yes gene_type:complete
MAKEKEEVQELEIPTELLEKDPIELAENDHDINEIIRYLRATRENIRATESAGKRITSKSARTKPKLYKEDPLSILVKEA